MLTPREIIAESWAITTSHRPLRYWGFFMSFFEILLDTKMIGYQMYLAYTYFIVGEPGGMFDDVEFLFASGLPDWASWTIIITFIILLIIELFIPSLGEGAIIGLTAKARRKEKVQGGCILALYNFFPILEIHGIFAFSGLLTFITASSLILRYGEGLRWFLVSIATFLWLVSFILRFFGSFAESGIVIEKLGVFSALGKSTKITLSYMRNIMFLMLLLAIISLRIIINAVVIILVPLIVVGTGLMLAHVINPVVSYTIASLLGLAILVVAAYFFAYLHIFKRAAWTTMYMEVIKEKDLDAIN